MPELVVNTNVTAEDSKPTEPKGKVVYVYYTEEYRIRLYDNVTTTTLRLARGNLSKVTISLMNQPHLSGR